MHPNAPLIKRQGEVDAWDNADFRAAVEATGKKQIILAGITTDVSILLSIPSITMHASSDGELTAFACLHYRVPNRSARRSSRSRSSRRAIPCTLTATRRARST